MKTYLFVGDTHGDIAFAMQAVNCAQQHGAEIVQLGDWGYYWPGDSRVKALSKALVSHGVTMRFVDGNHDQHPRLRKHVVACTATLIAPAVIYQPRGSVHEDEDGTRFLFLGGAPSIDRDLLTEGQAWWPEESITAAEFDRALSATGPVHVLVTHDAPDLPPGFLPKGSPDYQRDQALSMERVDALIKKHRPTLHIHGHWHTHYSRQHEVGTRVVGLHYNEAPFSDAVLLWSRATTESP